MPYISFTSTIQDIEVVVEGDFDKDEPDVNYAGGFDVCKVYLPSDRNSTDIHYLLEDKVIERLEHEGYMAGYEDAAENKRLRDHAFSLQFQPRDDFGRIDDGTAYMDDEQ